MKNGIRKQRKETDLGFTTVRGSGWGENSFTHEAAFPWFELLSDAKRGSVQALFSACLEAR